MAQPNPIAVLWSIARVLVSVDTPDPVGGASFQHAELDRVFSLLDGQPRADLRPHTEALAEYLASAAAVDPDSFDRDGALAYWINVYNAGALQLAAHAQDEGLESVLRVPGAFRRRFLTVAGENLSLDAIEHGKIRRFGDPRVHSALVCGSVSCPTLRSEVYEGHHLAEQLDNQMRSFLAGGGAVLTGTELLLSRVFSWFGSDFVKPHRMPTFIPSSKAKVAKALQPWLDFDVASVKSIEYQGYDWGLRCSVGAS